MASVTPRRNKDGQINDLLRKARADAWDEGCDAAIESVEQDRFIPVNPYMASKERIAECSCHPRVGMSEWKFTRG